MKRIVGMLIVMTLVLGACKKKEKGAENVTISFTLPTDGNTIPSWNQIHAEGTIVGDGEMSGYTVSILKTSSGEVLFTTSSDATAESYNFHEHWINNLQDTTAVTVKVDAIKNSVGDKETATRNVICLP